MILLKIRLRGVRRRYTIYVKGYIDREEVHENIISAEYRLFDRIPIYRKVLFTESVPLWAVINHCTLGNTFWQSKRPQIIDAAGKKRAIKTIRL